jgi:hypothetical protein
MQIVKNSAAKTGQVARFYFLAEERDFSERITSLPRGISLACPLLTKSFYSRGLQQNRLFPRQN